MNSLRRYSWVVVMLAVCLGQPVMALTTMSNSSLGVDSTSVTVKGGKMGVGTPTPQYTLEVRGNFTVNPNKTTGRGNMFSTMNVVVGSGVDWSVAPYQQVTVGNGGLSVTFVDPAGPCSLILLIKHTGTGSVSFPSVLWPGAITPAFSTAASNYDLLTLYYDGNKYYGEVNRGYQ